MARMSEQQDLWVYHWPKPAAGASLPAATAERLGLQGLYLDTCLRQLLLGVGPRPAPAGTYRPEIYASGEAWQLMLEIITGLRSAVPGETNVLGQFRRAWRDASAFLPADRRAALTPVVDGLLADARAIRGEHLQGVGGSSYGSLVRRLLAPAAGTRVLFVGTGELARSMIPLFRHCRVGIWNHRAADGIDGVERRFAPEEVSLAAGWAEHVIFTTPADDAHDAAWNSQLRNGRVRQLVHLGRRSAEAFGWELAGGAGNDARTWDLDDVFALARSRENVRSLQLARARLACAQLASTRAAGSSTSAGSIACSAAGEPAGAPADDVPRRARA